MEKKPQMDPKLMEAHRRVGLAAMKLVYDPKIAPQLVQMMSDDPQSIADAVMLVLDQLAEKMTGMEPGFVYSVGPAVLAFLMEIGEAAGLFKASPELQNAVAGIVMQGMKAKMSGKSAQPAAPQPTPPQSGLIGNAMQPETEGV